MFDGLGLPAWCASNWGSLAATLIAIILWRRYAIRRDSYAGQNESNTANGIPPTFPYLFPFLGTLPIAYLWKPRDLVLSRDNFFQSKHPVRVKILTQEFYAVRGAENIKAMFKASSACSSIPFVKFALARAFGLPARALWLFDKDDSGSGAVPYPDSTVEARNRIDYLNHQTVVQFLEGKGLASFWERFVTNITKQLSEVYEGLDSMRWEEQDDLLSMIGDKTTVAILNSFCGPHLLRLNPHFLQDFREFDRNLQTYLQGIPWFLAPRAYAARRRVLDAVRIWQEYARENFDDSAIDDNGDDQFWGSSFFRMRQKTFLEMDGFDRDAINSLDFGAIWASRNSIAATSWAVYDVYRDPELLANLRAEVDTCAVQSDNGLSFNIDHLLRLPTLQAVYAETLRLRMHFYLIRMPDRVDMNIQGSIIPRQKVIVAPTTVAHMDPEAWSTGMNGEHPLDQFWAGRFLSYPSKPTSRSMPEFSSKIIGGSWVPFGGGPQQCPGRHFAKRQILLTIAMMVSLFDCEVLDESVREDFTLWGFGSGVSNPVGKVPFRIRRRTA